MKQAVALTSSKRLFVSEKEMTDNRLDYDATLAFLSESVSGMGESVLLARTIADQLVTMLSNLERIAHTRTAEIDFEAAVSELKSEEQDKFNRAKDSEATQEKAMRLVGTVRKLLFSGRTTPDRLNAALDAAHDQVQLVKINREVYEAYRRCRRTFEEVRDKRLAAYRDRLTREYTVEEGVEIEQEPLESVRTDKSLISGMPRMSSIQEILIGIFRQGASAHERGMPRDACSDLDVLSSAREEWLRGWDSMETKPIEELKELISGDELRTDK